MNEVKAQKAEQLAKAVNQEGNVKNVIVMFASAMRDICDNDSGSGTEHKNTHPAVIAFVDHLRELTGGRTRVDEAYSLVLDRLKSDSAAKSLYDKYWGAMDACNLSGLVFSLERDLDAIEREATVNNETLATSPIIVIMVDKFAQLANI